MHDPGEVVHNRWAGTGQQSGRKVRQQRLKEGRFKHMSGDEGQRRGQVQAPWQRGKGSNCGPQVQPNAMGGEGKGTCTVGV